MSVTILALAFRAAAFSIQARGELRGGRTCQPLTALLEVIRGEPRAAERPGLHLALPLCLIDAVEIVNPCNPVMERRTRGGEWRGGEVELSLGGI